MVEFLRYPQRAFCTLIVVLLLATPQSAFASDLCAPGDANGDNSINVLDIVLILNAILDPAGTGLTPEDLLIDCAYLVAEDGTKLAVVSDVTCDGATNVLDIVTSVQRILNSQTLTSIAGDWDGDMYPAACDPCPGDEASPAPGLLCSFPDVTECAAAQADADLDGQVDQCQQGAGPHDVLNLKFRPAVGAGQSLLYQVQAAISWVQSFSGSSTNYNVTIEF